MNAEQVLAVLEEHKPLSGHVLTKVCGRDGERDLDGWTVVLHCEGRYYQGYGDTIETAVQAAYERIP